MTPTTPTIAQLWLGDLKPIIDLEVSSPEMDQLEELMRDNFESLKALLDTEGQKILQEYENCMDEYLLVAGEKAFCDGFCLGTKIVVEALNGAEQLTSKL